MHQYSFFGVSANRVPVCDDWTALYQVVRYCLLI